MARRAIGAVKDAVVAVRLSRHMVGKLDRRRGNLSRSEYIRAVLERVL